MKRLLVTLLFLCMFTSIAAAQCEIGAYLGEAELPTKANILDFESQTGTHLSSVMWYEALGIMQYPTFNTAYLSENVRYHDGYDTNTSLHITFEPWVNMQDIASGVYDNYFRGYADSCKQWGQEIRFRFAHEMIQDDDPGTQGWYSWQDDPVAYVAAFKHVREIFQQEQAANVKFVWSPNFTPNDLSVLAKYFPGTDYVDWIGIDGYNWGNPDQGFDQIFKNIYSLIVAHPEIFGQKPIMLGEFASADTAQKAAWIQDAFQKIKQEYPDIEAFYWFDVNKERDWRIDSSAMSLAAFRQAMQDPYFTSHYTGEGAGSPAPCSVRVSAELPSINSININVSKVANGTWLPQQAALDFGTLVFDPQFGIFRATCNYVIDVGIVSNSATWTVIHSVTSVTNGADNLDSNIDVVFMRQSGNDSSELLDVSFGRSNGVTFSKSQINSGWLRIYYGIATNADLSAGIQPITVSKSIGSYAGSVTLTLTS